jgi:acetylornithine deacetylase
MDPLPLLRELVAIDSVNPALVEGGRGEAAVADLLASRLRRARLDVSVQEVAPGRPNVVAVLEGRSDGPTLVFCGHTDTVGIGGMNDPFTPVERAGRLYGRGAQDMKSGVAAMVSAALALAERGGPARGRLVVAAVADEEHGSLGAEAFARDWRADLAIVTEPTDLAIGIAHKGFALCEVETRGVAAHGSRPADGRDAILRMGRVLGALEQLDRDLQAGDRHPLLGAASLHASTIRGGHEWSSYPSECLLQVERRSVPGEDGAKALREIEAILGVLRRHDPEFEAEARSVAARPPYTLDERAELPQALARACAAAGRPARFTGVSFWTDAAILGGAGIQSALFGPAGAGLHGRDEYVEIASVVACRDVLLAAALDLLG